jgi:hypothetical protein
VSLAVQVIDSRERTLRLGSLVLGYDGAGPRALGADVGGVLPFQPTTDRVFAASDTLRLFAPVFPAGAPQAGTFSVAIDSGNGPQPVTSGPIDGLKSGGLDLRIPLAGLTPGTYVLALEVAATGGDTAQRSIAFDVR